MQSETRPHSSLAACLFGGLLAFFAAAPAWGTLQAPTIGLSPASIAGASTSMLTITLANDPPGNPGNIAFNYTYPANVFNAETLTASPACGGTVSATSGGNTLSLSGGSISGKNSCTVTVSITSCDQADYSIGGFNVTSSSGSPTAGTATLQVTSNSAAIAATSTVSASPGSVPADGTTSATVSVTAINVCGTEAPGKSVSLSQGTGNSAITPASATTDASGVATFDVTNSFAETVTYTATVTTDSVIVTQTADVTFTPLNAPTVVKTFSPGTISVGGTSTLTVTITNPNNGTLTGLAFTDTYPAGLVNAAAPGLSNTCAGSATAVAGGNQLALTGGLLSGMSSCDLSVSVTSSSAGSYLNSTGPVISNNALAGAGASATLIVIAVSSFNVVEPGADALAGRIFTRIAGENIAADIVALDASNSVATGFTGTVAVELVDNSGGGACAALPLVKTLADQTFVAGDSGRHALSAGQFEANAYRNLRFRIKYPTASPTVTACSSDAFANRPKEFVGVQARDANRTTAGTTNILNNTSNPGIGTVHNAGRPFRIDATAQNGAGTPATTTLYAPDAGQPIAILSQCGVAAVCPAALGTLGTGAWSASAGVITSTTATYADVGAFDLALEDQSFASVDAADGTPTSMRYIRSAALLTVGRFAPDHFTLEAGSSITPRSDIAACAGSSFTYLGERMDLVFALTAREAGGAVTPGYTGAILGALVLNSAASYGFGAIDTAAPTPLSSRLDLALIPGVASSWSAGSVSITAPLSVSRDTAPDGPYGSLLLGIAPTDPDGVALRGADLNLDADNSGTPERAQVGAATAVRFGQLRMQNAYGSGKTALPAPIVLQYWRTLPAPAAFVTNADDSCTTLNRANIGLSAYEPYSSSPPATRDQFLQPCETAVTQATVSFASGVGSLTMASPDTASADTDNGKVLLTAHLRALSTPPPICPAAGSVCYCPGVGAAEADATTANKSYLLGRWDDSADPDGDASTTYDDNPSATATFGLYGSQPKNFIFFRENY